MIHESNSEAELSLGLRHKYFLSSDRTAPVVFLVHGRAGNFDVMWTFRRCIPEKFSIIAVQAPLKDPLGGYSWWNVEERFDLASHANTINKLTKFIQAVPLFYELKPSKNIALGFSQGGAILSILLQQKPSLFAAVGLLASFVIPISDARGTEIPIFIGHGETDDVIPITKAEQGVNHLQSLGFNVQYFTDPVGHKIGTQGMRELKRWIAELT